MSKFFLNRALKNPFCRLVKKVQMQGAAKTESRSVYRNTLSDEVCSVTKQMGLFQQPAKIFCVFFTLTLSIFPVDNFSTFYAGERRELRHFFRNSRLVHYLHNIL